MKLIGVGFGRTGTASVKTALERLGYGPCYHMSEVVGRSERVRQWLAVSQGDELSWDRVFDGFGSSVDWPGAVYWRELADHYPDAKLLLTVRDPEQWHRSVKDTIFRGAEHRTSGFGRLSAAALKRWSPEFGDYTAMLEEVVHQRVFGGDVITKEHLIRVFEQHIAQVRTEIPAERLLIFDVRHGWNPLCDFLGEPVPDEVFPHVNDADAYTRSFREYLTRVLLTRKGAEAL
jgi:hypothetical protein